MTGKPIPPGYTRIIGNIIGDGEVVPRGQSATSSSNPELQAKLREPIRRWKRVIEVTFWEEEIGALDLFIKEHYRVTRRRITEEEAVRVIVGERLLWAGR